MNDLTWIEDTNVRTQRLGIRSFVAVTTNPLFRFAIVGQGPEDSETWYSCKSEGAVFRRLGYLMPMKATTLEEAKRRCAEHQIPEP